MTLISQSLRAVFFAAFLLISFSSLIHAQVTDSLKVILKTSKEDTNKVNILAALVSELQLQNKYPESLPYIQKGLALAEKLNHTAALALLHRSGGDYYKNSFNYSKALQSYSKSLKYEIKDKRTASIALCYDKLAAVYRLEGEDSKVSRELHRKLKLYEEVRDTVKITESLIELWDLYYKTMYENKLAASYLDKVNGILGITSNDSVRALLYHRMGRFYILQGNYEKATEYLNESLTIYKQQNNQEKVALVYNNIGSLYEAAGDYPKMLEYFLKTLEIAEKLGEKGGIARAALYVGWGYQLNGDYSKALEYQLSAANYYEEVGNNQMLPFPLGNLGVIYNHLGDYIKAIGYSKRAMTLFEKNKDFGGVAEAYNNIGNCYVNTKQYAKAIEYLEKGLALAKDANVPFEQKNSYAGLAACYEKTGDYKKAYQNYKMFIQARDTIMNRENSERISKMYFSLESQKNQEALDLLNKNFLLNENNLKKQQALTGFAVACVILISFVLFFAIRGYKRKQKAQVQTEQHHAEIVLQKKEIEKAYQTAKILSDIGREITAYLSVEGIIQNVYKNLNQLMDASSFWIGIYNESKQGLEYPIGIENGIVYPSAFCKLSEDDRLSIWAFKNKKAVFINDYYKEYNNYIPHRALPPPLVGDNPESAIWYPLISKGGKTIGVFSLQSFKKNAYTEYDISIVRSLSVFIAIALENALLYEEVEQKVKERTVEVVRQKEEIEKSYSNTKLLSHIGREITASLQVEEIVEKVYERVNALMDAPVFLIGIYDASKNQLVVPAAIENNVKQPYYYYDLNDKARPAVWCFDNQKEMFINDYRAEYNTYFPGQEFPLPISGGFPESIIYYPLTIANKKIGVISFQSFRKNAYTEYHLDIIKSLAIYVVTALENARLYGNMEMEVKLRTAEIEMQRDELTLLSLVASETDNAIIITDVDTNIQWVNAGYTRLTGFLLDDLRRTDRDSILKLSSNPNIKEVIQECISKTRSVFYNAMNVTKAGREIWVQTTITPVLGADGKVKNLVAIDSDITDIKRVEAEVKKQHTIISEKNKHITDSINYAKRIQDAILPQNEVIKQILQDAFVFFKPKDIVSGDFYWMAEKKEKLYFAVADCTGHGVPGALVSIIGNNGLYRAVNEFGLVKPCEILDKLNELVDETFGKSNKNQIQDGMDIALCSYDRKTKELQFAGANNSLYIISNGTLSEIKGDKQPIGAFDHRRKFSNNAYILKEKDAVYLFSDGYADQFGGLAKKKFKYNQLKNLFLSIQGKSMTEQREALSNTMTEWMGDLEQVDDICVMGVRV